MRSGVVGRKVYGGSTQYLPVRVNAAGVMPIIFAQSIMFVPGTIAQFAPNNELMQRFGALFLDFTSGDTPSFSFSYVYSSPISTLRLRSIEGNGRYNETSGRVYSWNTAG